MKTGYVALLAVVLGGSSLGMNAQVAPVTVVSATANSSAEAIKIVYSDGSEITAPKLKDQVDFGRPLVAEDKRTVGWLAELPNCCTSYPIPLTLVIYRDGRIIASISPGRSIFHWVFLAGGKQVALCTDVLHGESFPTYELHEADDGRLVASWSPRETKKQPDWVGLLLSDNTDDLRP